MRFVLVLLLAASLLAVACSDDDYGRDFGPNDASASVDGAADLTPPTSD
jgi:hypothetical protein